MKCINQLGQLENAYILMVATQVANEMRRFLKMNKFKEEVYKLKTLKRMW